MWLREGGLNWVQRLCVKVLRWGSVPRHVAFIMDGNRRFATRKRIGVEMAHSWGFDKMTEALQWCLEIGVGEITVYAFSVANFGRPPQEVAALMGVARDKLRYLCAEEERFRNMGVRVRFVGERALLPPDVLDLVEAAEEATRLNGPRVLTVALAYSSRVEMVRALSGDVESLAGAPDLILRTSGEARLSDFLLWQSTASVLQFLDVLWPELSFWDLARSFLHYQVAIRSLRGVKPWTAASLP